MDDVVVVRPVGRAQCTAKSKRSGERCKRAPVRGLSVCSMHGGKTPASQAKSKRIQEQRRAQAAARRLGTPVEVDPGQALLDALYSAMGDLRFWEEVTTALEVRNGYADGIIGVNHLGDQALHVAARELADAQRRVAQISKWCIEANIGERRLQLIEFEAASVFETVIGALQKLGLDSPEVRVGIANEFRSRARRAEAIEVEGTEIT
jgi:hypothetical protein